MARRRSVAAERAVILLVFGLVFAFVFWLSLRVQRRPASEAAIPAATPPTTPAATPSSPPAPAMTPSPAPSARATPPAAESGVTTDSLPSVAPGSLVIPVAGVRPEQLRDTFNEARSEGRTHNALDIMAACETPVVAAVAGKILRLFTSERGGLTVYQLGPDDKTVYYYAHLSRYADDLAQGQTVAPGKLIGYVGDTGNAGPNNCHLHFAMWAVSDPKKFWSGEDINPYPLLSQAR
jgi:peptidoglycan LD-endopeptidase LytH